MSYPFSAVVGLDDLRLALLINAVSPAVGGVLVRGEKGTAKSTVVRALASLMPPAAVVEGCRFSCDPVDPDPVCPDGPHASADATTRPARLVELPVGASEDRLVGSLDLEKALTSGESAYQPGLLAHAHRGLLYVDEVNLLHDHLVDLLLDAAALGRSYVEREGVSVQHAARFLLVGTMNPEEGELRPQLLDRFGLTVEVTATRDPAERAEVVRRRLAYEADPSGFASRWVTEDADLAAQILAARQRLPSVVLTDRALREITTVCAAFDVDGLRADLVTAKASLALAAWAGRDQVTTEDVRTAARLALGHRRRRTPFEAPGLDEDRLDEALDSVPPEPADGRSNPDDTDPDSPPPGGPQGAAVGGDDAPSNDAPSDGEDPRDGHGGPDVMGDDGPDTGGRDDPLAGARGRGSEADERDEAEDKRSRSGPGERPAAAPGQTFSPVDLMVPGVNRRGGAAGRRSRSEGGSGRLTGSRLPNGRLQSLHLTATLRAAAPHQQARGRELPGPGGGAEHTAGPATGSTPGRIAGPLLLRRSDLREAVREGREGNLVLFVVDASGSMAARQRMSAVKGAVLSLLTDAYQRRDKVALISFRGAGADLVLPPTGSVEAAHARLVDLPTGGRTPINAALARTADVLRVEAVRDRARRALVVLVTDGRRTSGPDPELATAHLARSGAAFVVVDCESGPVRLGLANRLGAQLGGVTLRMDELSADGLAHVAQAGTRGKAA